MMELKIYNSKGKEVAQQGCPEDFFEKRINKLLLSEVVKMQLANRRAGTASTLTRGEMSGSTKKIYRQKGSGNARHGDIKAPIFAGGGQTFGPKPRDYSYYMPAKARKLALKSAISLRHQEGNLKLVDQIEFKKIKTKDAAKLFEQLKTPKSLLVIYEKNDVIEKSVRNLKSHKVIRLMGLNVYDILKFDQLIFTKEAFEHLNERIV